MVLLNADRSEVLADMRAVDQYQFVLSAPVFVGVENFVVRVGPPGPPTPISPAEGEVTSDATPLFQWQPPVPAIGVTGYRLQVASGDIETGPYVIMADSAANVTSVQPAAPLADGTYRWRVGSLIAGGVEFSGPVSFDVDTQVAAPSLASPPEGATVGDLTPTFGWSHAGDANPPVAFDLRATRGDINIGPFDLNEPGLGATNFTPVSPLPVGPGGTADYSWQVTARDGAGNAANSTVGSFTIDVNAPVVELVFPADGQIVTGDLRTFLWRAADLAPLLAAMFPGIEAIAPASYDLQIAADSFGNPFVDERDVPHAGGPETVQFHGLAAPLADGAYQWRVRGKKDDLTGDYTTAPFFVDLIAPGRPALLSPLDGEETGDNTPTFDWTDVVDTTGVTYEIQIDDNPAFTSPATTQGLTDSEFTPAPLADGTYNWRVQATDGVGRSSGFTDSRSVTIDTAPPTPPALVSPQPDEPLDDRMVTFRWDPSTSGDVAQHRLQVTTGGGTFNTLIDELLGSQNLAFTADIPDDGGYKWRVGAIDDLGNETDPDDLEVRAFTIQTITLTAPVLVAPLEVVVRQFPVLFQWTQPPDGAVDGYTLQVTSGDIETGPYDVNRQLPAGSTDFEQDELSDGFYRWRVIARDADNNEAPSAVGFFAVSTAVVEPPGPDVDLDDWTGSLQISGRKSNQNTLTGSQVLTFGIRPGCTADFEFVDIVNFAADCDEGGSVVPVPEELKGFFNYPDNVGDGFDIEDPLKLLTSRIPPPGPLARSLMFPVRLELNVDGETEVDVTIAWDIGEETIVSSEFITVFLIDHTPPAPLPPFNVVNMGVGATGDYTLRVVLQGDGTATRDLTVVINRFHAQAMRMTTGPQLVSLNVVPALGSKVTDIFGPQRSPIPFPPAGSRFSGPDRFSVTDEPKLFAGTVFTWTNDYTVDFVDRRRGLVPVRPTETRHPEMVPGFGYIVGVAAFDKVTRDFMLIIPGDPVIEDTERGS